MLWTSVFRYKIELICFFIFYKALVLNKLLNKNKKLINHLKTCYIEIFYLTFQEKLFEKKND